MVSVSTSPWWDLSARGPSAHGVERGAPPAAPHKGQSTQASNTAPIPLEGGAEWRCRYAFGYSLDGSEIPTYFLLPERTEYGSFYLLDCATVESFDLRATRSIETIGVEHFYESFGLQLDREKKRSMREIKWLMAFTRLLVD